MTALEERTVHLRLRLERVAPVDEDRRLLREDDGNARRARESRKPGEASRSRGHVFALMLVRARDEKALHAAPSEFHSQRRKTRGARTRLVGGKPLRHLDPERHQLCCERWRRVRRY